MHRVHGNLTCFFVFKKNVERGIFKSKEWNYVSHCATYVHEGMQEAGGQ